jgi:hypothetical protein
MTDKHSPLPWKVHNPTDMIPIVEVRDFNNRALFADFLVNCEFIVEAVNNHTRYKEQNEKLKDAIRVMKVDAHDTIAATPSKRCPTSRLALEHIEMIAKQALTDKCKGE